MKTIMILLALSSGAALADERQEPVHHRFHAAGDGDCRPIWTLSEDGSRSAVLPTSCHWTAKNDAPSDNPTFTGGAGSEGGASAE